MQEDELIAELNDALGVSLKRRASRFVGMPGFHVELANCAPGKLAQAWRRAVMCDELEIPVLFFRCRRKPYRALMALADFAGGYRSADLSYTVEMSVPSFALVFEELNRQRTLEGVVQSVGYRTWH